MCIVDIFMYKNRFDYKKNKNKKQLRIVVTDVKKLRTFFFFEFPSFNFDLGLFVYKTTKTT